MAKIGSFFAIALFNLPLAYDCPRLTSVGDVFSSSQVVISNISFYPVYVETSSLWTSIEKVSSPVIW